jgi:hypothetical protein
VRAGGRWGAIGNRSGVLFWRSAARITVLFLFFLFVARRPCSTRGDSSKQEEKSDIRQALAPQAQNLTETEIDSRNPDLAAANGGVFAARAKIKFMGQVKNHSLQRPTPVAEAPEDNERHRQTSSSTP